jgi:hypothetical protein
MSPLQKSCLISDEIAFVLLMAVVYFQVRYMMSLYAVKLQEHANHRDEKLRQMNSQNRNALENFVSDFIASMPKRIQPVEARFEALEGVFKGLITAESAVAAAEGARIRGLLKSGACLGWKQYELQLHAQLGEAVQREAAWQKAAGWV